MRFNCGASEPEEEFRKSVSSEAFFGIGIGR
jgi:hypothetical protein